MSSSLELGRVAGPGGQEPAGAGLGLVHEHGRALVVRWRGSDLFRYVYRPWEPQLESPRPYFHPLRTLGGDLVSLYRPHDHVWHKGISFSLSNVGDDNFWGGPTYTRSAQAYQQLDNNGEQRHTGFERLAASGDGGGDGDGDGARNGTVQVVENLDWISQAGQTLFTERRSFAVRAHPEQGAWQLAYATRMLNTSGRSVSFGSPTTKGRTSAGYSGLFWRGPRSFSGGVVVTPEGTGGDEQMGRTGPWLGFVGRHDGAGVASTLVFRDHESNSDLPTRWFVRTGVFAAVCPAPFFDVEHEVAAGDSLTLRYDVVIADGPRDVPACAALARTAKEHDLLAE